MLDGGRVGATFRTGSRADLASELVALLADDARRPALGVAGQRYARRFDWDLVAADVVAVYETVLEAEAAGQAYAQHVPGGWATPGSRPLTRLLRRRERDGDRGHDEAAYQPRRVGPPAMYLDE